MNTYRKIATVKAKIFKKGDEDGFIHPEGLSGAMEDARYGIKSNVVPFIKTLENNHHIGEFGKNYLCIGIDGERWLVEKSIFERTYEEVKYYEKSIELPTDEEIEAYLKSFKYTKHLDDGQYNDGVIDGAELGIEWVMNKIQGGNK